MKVLITKPFKLNLGMIDGIHKIVEYETGTRDMPEDHFKHWWSQTHGVKSLEQETTPPVVRPLRPVK